MTKKKKKKKKEKANMKLKPCKDQCGKLKKCPKIRIEKYVSNKI